MYVMYCRVHTGQGKVREREIKSGNLNIKAGNFLYLSRYVFNLWLW